MAEHWWNWSSSPYADGQQPPAEHSENGQRTGEFNIDDVTGTDNDWDAESNGGLAVEFIGSGLSGNMTRLYHDSGLGSTIRDEGPDYEVVDRIFRGGGGQGGLFNAFTVLRQHGTGNNHYLLGIRETSGGALRISIFRMSDGEEKPLDGVELASKELGPDHDVEFPIDTEGWIKARAEDDSGNSNTQLKVKFWVGSAGDEPSDWDLETTDDEYYDTKGYIGCAVVRGEIYFDVRGVGTGGDSAPTEEPGAGSDHEGTATQTLAAIVQSASAEIARVGTIEQTLGSMVQSGSATQAISTSIAQTLPELTQNATGQQIIASTTTQLLPILTQDAQASGPDARSGVAEQTLPMFEQLANVAVTYYGSVSQVMAAMEQSGSVITDRTATIDQQLAAMQQQMLEEGVEFKDEDELRLVFKLQRDVVRRIVEKIGR